MQQIFMWWILEMGQEKFKAYNFLKLFYKGEYHDKQIYKKACVLWDRNRFA